VGAASEAALEQVPMEVVPVQKVPSPAKIQPSPKTEVDHVAEMKIRFCNGDRPPLYRGTASTGFLTRRMRRRHQKFHDKLNHL